MKPASFENAAVLDDSDEMLSSATTPTATAAERGAEDMLIDSTEHDSEIFLEMRLTMSLAQPSERTTCPQCGLDGVFGYRNKDGDLIWNCADHRLGRFWADARRDVVEPTFPASGQPDQQHPPPRERFEHHCWCGNWGSFGYGVNLRNGGEGSWFCRMHRPR